MPWGSKADLSLTWVCHAWRVSHWVEMEVRDPVVFLRTPHPCIWPLAAIAHPGDPYSPHILARTPSIQVLTSLLDTRQIQTNRLPNKYHNLPETSCPQKPPTPLKTDCSYRIQMLWGTLTAGKFIIDAGMHGTPRRRVRAEGQNWMVGIFSLFMATHISGSTYLPFRIGSCGARIGPIAMWPEKTEEHL